MVTIEKRLTALEEAVANAGLNQKEVLTFNEACTYTGLSKSWLYKMTSTKQVPHYKAGGKLTYFDRIELVLWLKQNRVTPIEEIEAQAQKHCLTNRKGKQNV